MSYKKRRKKRKTTASAFFKMMISLTALLCVIAFGEKVLEYNGLELTINGIVDNSTSETGTGATGASFDISMVSEYEEEPYEVINGNVPFFNSDDYKAESFEHYSELDSLGRCGEAFACVGKDIMPKEERGAIGHVKPAGWHTIKYDCIPDRYLYNRCHLIAFELTGENANVQNLTTGTRYMNATGMLPFENKIAAYVKDTNNHVLYRVTPIFVGEELVCRGVLMEAMSMEDGGEGICFCVFCYDVQPGVVIDYLTGDSYEK